MPRRRNLLTNQMSKLRWKSSVGVQSSQQTVGELGRRLREQTMFPQFSTLALVRRIQLISVLQDGASACTVWNTSPNKKTARLLAPQNPRIHCLHPRSSHSIC